MGTLGCINDMLRRDKENRELRKISRERLNETRNRLLETGRGGQLPNISVEELEEIRQKTIEKEEMDNNHLFKAKLLLFGSALLIVLLGWALYSLLAV